MEKIAFNCTADKQNLYRICGKKLYSSIKNYAYVIFNLSEQWQRITPIALFKSSEKVLSIEVINGIVVIPWEMTAHEGIFTLSLYGGDLLTTNEVNFDVFQSGYQTEIDVPTEPTPTIYNDMLDICKKCVSVKTDADNGEFDGKHAYQSALDGGYIGTEAQFNNDLTLISNKANYSDILIEQTERINDDTSIRTLATQAKQIAEGKNSARVFNTYSEMHDWLLDSAHSATLRVGDNLLIRDTSVPDYWWDGNEEIVLETRKVDLSEYLKNTNDIKDTVTAFSEAANLENIVSGEKESIFKGKLKKWFSSVVSKVGNVSDLTFGIFDNIVNALNSLYNSKSDKTIIENIDGNSHHIYLTLKNNHKYRIENRMYSLTIDIWSQSLNSNFISSVVFDGSQWTMGNTIQLPFVASYGGLTDILYTGDDCVNHNFTVNKDKRYNVVFYYDGKYMNGIVRGVVI